MVDYHVDACEEFQERMATEMKFRGKLSVRKAAEVKPIISFGHDECMYCTSNLHTPTKLGLAQWQICYHTDR